MKKNKKITVQNIDIVLYETNKQDYISLTDITRYRDSENEEYKYRVLRYYVGARDTPDAEIIVLKDDEEILLEAGKIIEW